MPDRKDAARLTTSEQNAFRNAITAMVRDGSYERMARYHGPNMGYNMHSMGSISTGTLRFLPWHRTYLWAMETEMRRRVPRACH